MHSLVMTFLHKLIEVFTELVNNYLHVYSIYKAFLDGRTSIFV